MKENISPNVSSTSQIILEYNSLKQYSPSGVYTLPSISNIFIWHGLIFIRQGYFKDGVFTFRIEIPKDYPVSRPSVYFTSYIYHPLIDPESGQLSLDAKFSSWTAGKDFIFSILAYIKSIFYYQDFWTHNESIRNPKALTCALQDPDLFALEAQSCVNSNTVNDDFFQIKEFNSVHNLILSNIKKNKERPSEFIRYFKDNFT